MISGDPAVRRKLTEAFVLAQIWVRDPAVAPLDREQKERMKGSFGIDAIPLHVVLGPQGEELARYGFDPTHGPRDYLAFLERGLARFRELYP